MWFWTHPQSRVVIKFFPAFSKPGKEQEDRNTRRQHKVRTRIIWILATLGAICTVALTAFLLNPSFLPSDDLVLKEEGLLEGEAILVRTGVEGFGVQKGDAFLYSVEVWYNPDLVSGIDRASVDKGLNLQPFEIREITESESDLDSRTRVYRREYEVQLIHGDVDALYEFPSLVVRYTPEDSEGLFEKTVVPEAIFVAPRLPPDVAGLELRPLKGEVEDVSRKRPPWILWTLGGFLMALGAVDLAWRTIPQRRELTKQRRKVEGGEVLVQAYRSLCGNVAIGSDRNRLLHQMDHILRLVLARKEKVDWLEEPDLDSVAPDIRPAVTSLFEQLGKTHAMVVEHGDTEESLRLLEGILHFYFGEVEVESWRS
jgi:hypothetical protein